MSTLAIIQQALSLVLAGFALVLVNRCREPEYDALSFLSPIAIALIAIAVKP